MTKRAIRIPPHTDPSSIDAAEISRCREAGLAGLGLRESRGGVHTARSMMLADLGTLLRQLPESADRDDYAEAIVIRNVLGKPTGKTRELTLRHLRRLYALDPDVALFRALRRLWAKNAEAQPLLALIVALARDPLLRSTADWLLGFQPGTVLKQEQFEGFLLARTGERFSAASRRSIGQNIAATWTHAGFLAGRVNKLRVTPAIHPEHLVMSLFVGYLEGRSGQRLFTSEWTRVLQQRPDELESLATAACHRGMLVVLSAGGIKEVRFPGYLRAEEEQVREEISRVV